MSLIDELVGKAAPHVDYLTQTIGYHGARITEELRELRRESDLGRPDTGDNFKFINVRSALNHENYVIGEPTLGEVWLVQAMCVNGKANVTPEFVVRTNTGRLVFAVVKEGMGLEIPGGD